MTRLFRKRKPLKLNPIEKALNAFSTDGAYAAADKFDAFKKFLESKYGITGLRLVIPSTYNAFLMANDGPRRLFIKTGPHNGIYENEYKMGRALYDIDPVHFLEPLYYNDFSEFNFFANEYTHGETLKSAKMHGHITPECRATLIHDLHQIFLALNQSDVVHRDIRPDNLMIINNRLVLIDFQLAVSKSNYVELEYLRTRPRRLRNLGDPLYQYKPFVWDDAHSLLKVLQFIGHDDKCVNEYKCVYHDIRAGIGNARIKSSVREGAIHRAIRHLKRRK